MPCHTLMTLETPPFVSITGELSVGDVAEVADDSNRTHYYELAVGFRGRVWYDSRRTHRFLKDPP